MEEQVCISPATFNYDCSIDDSLDGSFPPDLDFEGKSGSRSLTFRVAVLPPVLGPVMITALVSGLTHTSIATGPFASTAASSWFSAANMTTLTTNDLYRSAAYSCCNAKLQHSGQQVLNILRPGHGLFLRHSPRHAESSTLCTTPCISAG